MCLLAQRSVVSFPCVCDCLVARTVTETWLGLAGPGPGVAISIEASNAVANLKARFDQSALPIAESWQRGPYKWKRGRAGDRGNPTQPGNQTGKANPITSGPARPAANHAILIVHSIEVCISPRHFVRNVHSHSIKEVQAGGTRRCPCQ